MPHVASKGSATAQIGVIRGSQGQTEPTRPGMRMAIELHSPVQAKLRDFILDNRKTVPLEMAQPGVFAGQSLALCGAGPSLRTQTIEGVNQLWACNSALPWLVAQGATVDAGVGIDQSPGLLREWAEPPDVPYYVASSCDPALIHHLQSRGRRLIFFHNFVGCDPNEHQLYCETWPPTLMVGEGASVVSRTIGLALWMGFERIDVYGADCCFGEGDMAHANGEVAQDAYANPLIMTGEFNGRTYRARPDMLLDAVGLVRRVRSTQGRVRLMGDTMPVALLGKDDAFLDLVARRILPGAPVPAPD